MLQCDATATDDFGDLSPGAAPLLSSAAKVMRRAKLVYVSSSPREILAHCPLLLQRKPKLLMRGRHGRVGEQRVLA